MDGLSDRENQLAEELKEICDENGRELIPIDSAPVLHQLGLIYKDKSPDKISLIQSTALFNAAIARQPTNVQFKEDLILLCSHLLQLANAKQQETDLIEFSVEVKKQINLMREETNSSLKLLKNIPCDVSDEEVKVLEKEKTDGIESIQNQIAESYTNIMDFISKKCIEIMGVPPCRYAIAGMGSLARKEITPYSDFEHVILLEDGVEGDDNYDKMVEYFRWYSVIFHIIVINLQETIIPSVSILSLNNFLKGGKDCWFFDAHTTRGISFDGMMIHASKFPLGRTEKTEKKPWTTELIRPVSQMLHLLDSKEAIKNGYHLADILTTTCFVSGDEEIYNDFNNKVKIILKQNRKSDIQLLKEQLEEDLSNYDLTRILSSVRFHNQVNIKRLIYRSITLFVLAIGRFSSVFERSCFEVIKSLGKENFINEETTHRLSYAVAVACQTRLQVYMSKCGQDDYVGEGGHYLKEDNQIIPKLIEIIGERSLIDCCIVACSMHAFLKSGKQFGNLNGILQNDSDFIKFQVWLLLHMYDRVLKEWEYYLKQKSSIKPEIDLMIRYIVCNAYMHNNEHGTALTMLERFDQLPMNGIIGAIYKEPFIGAYTIVLKLICLSNLKRHADVIRFVKATITRIQKFNVEVDANLLYHLHYCDGNSKCELNGFDEAFTAFIKALKCSNCSDPRQQETRRLDCLLHIAQTLFVLKNFKQAFKKAKESLTICETLKPESAQLADCYRVLAIPSLLQKTMNWL